MGSADYSGKFKYAQGIYFEWVEHARAYIPCPNQRLAARRYERWRSRLETDYHDICRRSVSLSIRRRPPVSSDSIITAVVATIEFALLIWIVASIVRWL